MKILVLFWHSLVSVRKWIFGLLVSGGMGYLSKWQGIAHFGLSVFSRVASEWTHLTFRNTVLIIVEKKQILWYTFPRALTHNFGSNCNRIAPTMESSSKSNKLSKTIHVASEHNSNSSENQLYHFPFMAWPRGWFGNALKLKRLLLTHNAPPHMQKQASRVRKNDDFGVGKMHTDTHIHTHRPHSQKLFHVISLCACLSYHFNCFLFLHIYVNIQMLTLYNMYTERIR